MPNYIFYNIQRFKTEAQISGAYNHNERQKEEYLSNPDIHRNLSSRNYHIKKCEKSYSDYVWKRIKDCGAKTTKTSVVLVDGVISPSPEWIKSKTIEEQIEVFYRAFEFVVLRFTYDNVISAVVHMDEETPHMHFDVVPISPDGRVCVSDYYPYPNGGGIEQYMFYEHMSAYFPDLSRGMPRILSQRDHVAMTYFKAAPDFFDMHEKMLEAINSIDYTKNGVSERKKMAVAFYTALSKTAANTIVMQQAELDYYKKKLIPMYQRAIEKTNKNQIDEIDKDSELSLSPLLENIDDTPLENADRATGKNTGKELEL